jgi:hypothetical protein
VVGDTEGLKLGVIEGSCDGTYPSHPSDNGSSSSLTQVKQLMMVLPLSGPGKVPGSGTLLASRKAKR